MIKRLIWTIWTPMSSVLKKADKLNLSLSLSHNRHLIYPMCDLSYDGMSIVMISERNDCDIMVLYCWAWKYDTTAEVIWIFRIIYIFAMHSWYLTVGGVITQLTWTLISENKIKLNYSLTHCHRYSCCSHVLLWPVLAESCESWNCVFGHCS